MTIDAFDNIAEKGPSETEHLKTLNLGGTVQNDPALTVSGFAESVATEMGVTFETVQTVMFSKYALAYIHVLYFITFTDMQLLVASQIGLRLCEFHIAMSFTMCSSFVIRQFMITPSVFKV